MKVLFPLKEKVLVDIETILTITEETVDVPVEEGMRNEGGRITTYKTVKPKASKQIRVTLEGGAEYVLVESWDSFIERLSEGLDILE